MANGPLRTLVAIGSTTAPCGAGTPAVPVTTIFVLPIREVAVLGRLFVNSDTITGAVAAVSTLETLQVSNIVHNNISYCTGATPASTYQSDAIGSPRFGIPISVNDQLQVELQNVGAATLGTKVAFSVL
jgi:hypothetical protein